MQERHTSLKYCRWGFVLSQGKARMWFREKEAAHGLVFDVITLLMQYDMENGSPLFDVKKIVDRISLATLFGVLSFRN